MYHLRRKTITLVTGGLFIFYSILYAIEIYIVQQSNDVHGVYINGYIKDKSVNIDQSLQDDKKRDEVEHITIRHAHDIVKGGVVGNITKDLNDIEQVGNTTKGLKDDEQQVGNITKELKDTEEQNLTSPQNVVAPRLLTTEKRTVYELLSSVKPSKLTTS